MAKQHILKKTFHFKQITDSSMDKINLEEEKGGFHCCHCSQWIPFTAFMGTKHRNHCPLCLWSKNVDYKIPGDRASQCQAGMQPIGLTFKHEGVDKYGKVRQGEIMIVHECTGCEKFSINRIAADDSPDSIIKLFQESQKIDPNKRDQLEQRGIQMVPEEKKSVVLTQLYGKNFNNS